tara:strand:- start:206 stop:385 length:180 start_codon:yes stop_codon:yes gene_type:complete
VNRGLKMLKPNISKNLFIRWETKDLISHHKFLSTRIPNRPTILATQYIEEILRERGVIK